MLQKPVYFVLSLIFLFSSLNLTDKWHVTGIYLVYLIITLSTIILLFRIREKLFVDSNTSVAMYLFIISCGVSAWINADLISIFDSMMIAILYVVSFVIVPRITKDINKTLVAIVLITHIPILLFPLFTNGFDTSPYRGIFYNPNSLGCVAATIFAVLMACMLGYLENSIKSNRREKQNKTKLLTWGALVLFTFYLVVVSASRTSFISTIVCTLIGFFCLSLYSMRNKRFHSFLIKGFVISALAVLAINFTPLYDELFTSVFQKFELQANTGDMLAQRGDIWHKTIAEAGVFGNGSSYFAENIKLGAHNTFVSIIGQYGWFSVSIFILFLVTCIYYSIRYLSNRNDKYKYLPLMMVINFCTLSMAEVMSFTLSMLLMFFSLGSTVIRKELLVQEVVPPVKNIRSILN